MPSFDSPLASIGDAPEMHTFSYSAQLNAIVETMREAGALFAEASRWR